MKPIIPITDSRFVYSNSASTDLRKTFARIRKEMAAQAQAKPQTHAVIQIVRKS